MSARKLLFAFVVSAFVVSSVCANASGESVARPHTASNPARSLSAIGLDVRAALTSEAKSRKQGENGPEVVRLVDLYREMAMHPKRETSDLLMEMALQVRSRLTTVRERIERQLGGKSKKGRAVVPSSQSSVLAQQAPAAGARANAGAQGMTVTGIPGVSTGQVDYGPQLVELIEATISPGTWRVNGGRGAVVYYEPFHVLVVGAPADVQEKVSGTILQLNAAQRQADGTQVVVQVGQVQAGQAAP